MDVLSKSNMASWKIPKLNGGFYLGKSSINIFSMAMFDYPILSHCQGQFQQENIDGAKKYQTKKLIFLGDGERTDYIYMAKL
jgi:hypothetical protein